MPTYSHSTADIGTPGGQVAPQQDDDGGCTNNYVGYTYRSSYTVHRVREVHIDAKGYQHQGEQL